MTDTLGESQVLSYLGRLSRDYGHTFHIVSAEKPDLLSLHGTRIRDYCRQNDLVWHPVSYHKHPPVISTIKDHFALRKKSYQLCQSEDIDLVHCRGYLPALSGLSVKRRFHIPLIFDMRGFWPDEKIESGAWASILYKPIYSYFKDREKAFFRQSDRIVSLTQKGKEEILKQVDVPGDKIGVIPTCVDFTTFKAFDQATRNRVRHRLGIPSDAHVLVYSGSLGGNYDIRIPFAVFDAYQHEYPNAHFLILSRSNPNSVQEYARLSGMPKDVVTVTSVPFPAVSDHLMAGDAGLIFYGEGFSNAGRSPTKLGEYWASGLPAITFTGIGDVDTIVANYPGSGVVAKSLNSQDLRAALRELRHSADAATLRQSARDYYSLDKGVYFYQSLYSELAGA